MSIIRSLAVFGIVAAALALAPSQAHALELTQDQLAALSTPFGPCHNDPGCGGYYIRWQGTGFAPNAPAHLQINNLTISMSSEGGTFGGLHKVNGNVQQNVLISLFSSEGATFSSGSHQYTNILGMTLTSDTLVHFVGTRIFPHDQQFTLTIFTTQGNIVFHLCSIQGSNIAFNRLGSITGLHLHFCGSLQGVTPPPPPPTVPEPTSLFAFGLIALAAVRRKLA